MSRYELEKKAALAPKPTTAYRTVRTADGALVQRPVASVRPMQHGARWIPADVWRRQGMTAQEMTLPLGKSLYPTIKLDINHYLTDIYS